MISGPSQCPIVNGRDLRCCIAAKYIRSAAVEGSNLQALGPIGEEISLPPLENPNLVSLGSGDQGEFIPYPFVEQDPNSPTTGSDGSESSALLPSDGLLNDPGNVPFSLPEGVNSNGFTPGSGIEYPTLPGPEPGIFSPGPEEGEAGTGTGAISFLPPPDSQTNAGGDFKQFWG